VIARPNVIVGVHLDGDASRLYVNFHGGPNDPPVRDVRRILEMRLAELESMVGALGDVLATDQPERAEQLLFDDARIRVSEVVLRPVDGRAAVKAFVQRTFERSD